MNLPYPSSLPIESVQTVIGYVRSGLAEPGKPGDLGCVVHSAWNLLGYGLSLGIPCEHPELKHGMPRSLHQLPELLTSAGTFGVADNRALPWAKIIPVLFQLLQILLAEQHVQPA